MVLVFKELAETELEWARLLHNDPSTLEMLTDTHVVQPYEQHKWFERLQNSHTSRRIVVFQEEVPIGLIRLDNIDSENKSICVGLDIDKQYRGQKLSYPIYKWILDTFFSLGFHRIWLLVADYNVKAKHIYSKIGFKEEGKQFDALFRFGEYHDYVMMSILFEEYKESYNETNSSF